MGNTTYNSDDPRTKAIKNSYIGRTARSLFIQKNSNATICNQWEGMTDIAIKLPDALTILNIVTPFPLTAQSAKEILRFVSSLAKGSTAFVGSVSVNIEIDKIKEGDISYIQATYKVLNTVSSQSYYLRLPDIITGKPIPDWNQIYEWKERFQCCDLQYLPNIIPPGVNLWPSCLFP